MSLFGSLTTNLTRIDKFFVAGVFISSCIFGISLAFYPSWFKKLYKQKGNDQEKLQTRKALKSYRGHHPDCSQFQNHILKTKTKTLCAGCIGLTVGAIISIFLMFLYISLTPNLLTIAYNIFIIIGIAIISLTYIEIILPLRHPVIHMIVNILLIFSFLLLTISILEITKNKLYGFITLILSLLWLETRIQLSIWKHKRICGNCINTCKIY
jgi:hypothetical protein